jgi:hypothetical protein
VSAPPIAPALLAVLGLAGCGDAGTGAGAGGGAGPRRTAIVQRGVVASRVLMTGELRAASSIDLTVPRTDAWELSIRWMAEDGAQVAAGERVLEFDNSAFTSQLAQRKLAVLQAAMDLQSGQDVATLATADREAAAAERRIAVEKARVLASVPADLLPGRTAQERQLDLTRALAALATAETELTAHKKASALDLRVKQIALTKARAAIDDATRSMTELVLTAPRAGVVAVAEHPWEGRRLHVGDSVQPGWPVLILPDTSQGLEVRAELSDVDDGKVAVGQDAGCVLDAYPEVTMPCRIVAVTPVARAEGRETLRKAFDVTLTLGAAGAPALAASAGAGAGSGSGVGSGSGSGAGSGVGSGSGSGAGSGAGSAATASPIPGADGVQARPGMSVKVVVNRAPVEALIVPRGAVVVQAPGPAPVAPASAGAEVAPAAPPGTTSAVGVPGRVRLARGGVREVVVGPCDAQGCAVEGGLGAGDVVLIGGGS